MPPNTQAPPPAAAKGLKGRLSIKSERSLPFLGTDIDATVNDNSVVLTGNVDTAEQYDLAISIAQANTGDRNIVDRIKVKQRT